MQLVYSAATGFLKATGCLSRTGVISRPEFTFFSVVEMALYTRPVSDMLRRFYKMGSTNIFLINGRSPKGYGWSPKRQSIYIY